MIIYKMKSDLFHKTIIVILLFLIRYVNSYSYLMPCGTTWPPAKMAAGSLGKMGTSVASATYNIIVGGVTYSGTQLTGTYTPSTTAYVSISNFANAGQSVYQVTSANGGGFVTGSLGKNNVNGLLASSGAICAGVTRYQQYGSASTGTVALLTFPASGTVIIESNYATTSGTGKTFVSPKVTLTPSAPPSTIPPIPPTSTPIQPSLNPTNKPPTYSPSRLPSITPTQVPITLFPSFKPSTSSPTLPKPSVKPGN